MAPAPIGNRISYFVNLAQIRADMGCKAETLLIPRERTKSLGPLIIRGTKRRTVVWIPNVE